MAIESRPTGLPDRSALEVTQDHLRAFREGLLDWYRRSHRTLPWRGSDDPYHVLVSEMILQQTRVEQGLPYYERFTARFPSLAALAAAEEEEVLRVWEGLGYYRRARDLHATARLIRERHGGVVPDDLEALAALPGLGPYTAAAVGSIAYGLPHAALDGNALRVLSRVFRLRDDPRRSPVRRRLQSAADRLIPPEAAGDFNQAVMELGARVCTPRGPDCAACPLAGVCGAQAEGDPTAYPATTRRPHRELRTEAALVLFDDAGRLLVRRRPPTGLLGGLWEIPSGPVPPGSDPHPTAVRLAETLLPVPVAVGAPLASVRHGFSHFRLQLEVFAADLPRPDRPPEAAPPLLWAAPEERARLPFPRFIRKLVERLAPPDRMEPPDLMTI